MTRNIKPTGIYRRPMRMRDAIPPFVPYPDLALLGLVDADPEPIFDHLTAVAQETIGTPTVLLSIVDYANDRQYFKSLQGLPEPWRSKRETPLSHSFCKHVIQTPLPLVVDNAPMNALVRDNAAVQDLGVIAYLGVPVFDQHNRRVGAFCAIDGEERAWRQNELEIIEHLAACASEVIRMKAALNQISIPIQTSFCIPAKPSQRQSRNAVNTDPVAPSLA